MFSKKNAFIALVLFGLVFPACPNGPMPITNEMSYCQAAETHLKELGCIPMDKPYTAKGRSFKQFCQDTMMNGINLHPKCLAEITQCNQMNSCVQR